jgi:hypothetical protein
MEQLNSFPKGEIRRRYVLRPAIAVVVLATLPLLWTRFKLLSARSAAAQQADMVFKKCLTYTDNRTGPVFDESRDTIPVLVLENTGNQSWCVARSHSHWASTQPGPKPLPRISNGEALLGQLDWLASDATTGMHSYTDAYEPFPVVLGPPPYQPYIGNPVALYLHERRNAKGRRLVAVLLDVPLFEVGNASPIAVRVLAPSHGLQVVPNLFSGRFSLGFDCPKDKLLQFYFGQSDANDASHFTIQYRVGPTLGSIEGWLNGDDSVRLLPSSQP